jgi:hypothetical protein
MGDTHDVQACEIGDRLESANLNDDGLVGVADEGHARFQDHVRARLESYQSLCLGFPVTPQTWMEPRLIVWRKESDDRLRHLERLEHHIPGVRGSRARLCNQ